MFKLCVTEMDKCFIFFINIISVQVNQKCTIKCIKIKKAWSLESYVTVSVQGDFQSLIIASVICLHCSLLHLLRSRLTQRHIHRSLSLHSTPVNP